MIIINLENKLLEKFQVEELEKRYEFACVDSVNLTLTVITEPNHEDPFAGRNVNYYGNSVKINF